MAVNLQLQAQQIIQPPATIGIIGDTADIATETKSGIVLIGGGGDVNVAFEWMISRSGGGDIVVITA